jgi:hypothetical protein
MVLPQTLQQFIQAPAAAAVLAAAGRNEVVLLVGRGLRGKVILEVTHLLLILVVVVVARALQVATHQMVLPAERGV